MRVIVDSSTFIDPLNGPSPVTQSRVRITRIPMMSRLDPPVVLLTAHGTIPDAVEASITREL